MPRGGLLITLCVLIFNVFVSKTLYLYAVYERCISHMKVPLFLLEYNPFLRVLLRIVKSCDWSSLIVYLAKILGTLYIS